MYDRPGRQQLGIGQWRPYTSYHEEEHRQWCSTCESSVVAQEDYNTTEEHEVGEGNVRESSRCAIFVGAQGVVIAVCCASDGGKGSGPLKVCLVNLGEELISLKRKQNLATAVEIDALVDTEDLEETQEKDIGGCEVRSIQAAGDSVVDQEKPEQSQSESQGQEEEQELPEHVRCLYEECQKRLTAEQAKFVRELLIDFADAFATHDLDIGRFTICAHRIRTGKAMSLRKSMRRTPLGGVEDFEGDAGGQGDWA